MLKPKKWRRTRLSILKRDKHRCRYCGRGGPLQIDHIVPMCRGGAWYDPKNLQALCSDCHKVKTRKEHPPPKVLASKT